MLKIIAISVSLAMLAVFLMNAFFKFASSIGEDGQEDDGQEDN